jgi:hypothetical protein
MPRVHWSDSSESADELADGAEPFITLQIPEPQSKNARWTSEPGLSLKEALAQWLGQLDLKRFRASERVVLARMIITASLPHTPSDSPLWHYPALPWSFKTEENKDRLERAMTYSFSQQNGRWTFWNLSFSSHLTDPLTGTVIVRSLDAWSTILDSCNHFRQERGWPLLEDVCYRNQYGSGLCTCDRCDGPRYADLAADNDTTPTDTASPSTGLNVIPSMFKKLTDKATALAPEITKAIAGSSSYQRLGKGSDELKKIYDNDTDRRSMSSDDDWKSAWSCISNNSNESRFSDKEVFEWSGLSSNHPHTAPRQFPVTAMGRDNLEFSDDFGEADEQEEDYYAIGPSPDERVSGDEDREEDEWELINHGDTTVPDGYLCDDPNDDWEIISRGEASQQDDWEIFSRCEPSPDDDWEVVSLGEATTKPKPSNTQAGESEPDQAAAESTPPIRRQHLKGRALRWRKRATGLFKAKKQ